METNKDGPILIFSFIICVLMIVSSFFGLFMPGFYDQETLNWRIQSKGQDTINLVLIAPILIFTALVGFSKGFYGTLMWAGAILYIIYTYLIYCFSIHFNMFFIDYCLILGLSFYGMIYFLVKNGRLTRNVQSIKIDNLIGIYFLLISVIFYVLWLSEIIPSIRNETTPQSIVDAGLFTNPVHVLDLSVVLPGIFITGIAVLRKNRIGLLIAPILLMFFFLMDLTIGWLILVIKLEGGRGNPVVSGIMGLLAIVSLLLLMGYKRALNTEYI